MSNRQRLTYLAIAAVIAVVAVVAIAIGSGGDDEEEAPATTAAQTATPKATQTTATEEQATATPTPTPKPQPPLLQPGSVKELSYKSGDTVAFRVRSPKADEVHVHGYDIERELEPNKTITVAFKANLEGIFDVELHSTDEKIADLKVEPK